MRKIFTPLLLIPCIVVFFACSKHESHPAPGETGDTVFTQQGNVNATIATNNFQSFNLISARDAAGNMNIAARALINKDTCELSLNFMDTLHPNVTYINYLTTDTTAIAQDTFYTANYHLYLSVGFYDEYLGSMYLSDANRTITGDTLVITSFD